MQVEVDFLLSLFERALKSELESFARYITLSFNLTFHIFFLFCHI